MNKWFFERTEQKDQITSAKVFLIFNRDRFFVARLFVNMCAIVLEIDREAEKFCHQFFEETSGSFVRLEGIKV